MKYGVGIEVQRAQPALLLLEVKGGQIEMRDGWWHQNGHAMESPPLNQAFAFRSLLIERFKELNMNRPKIGCAVCFPDAIFEKGPPGDDLDGLVIGEKDLPYLKEVLAIVMEHAVPITGIHRIRGFMPFTNSGAKHGCPKSASGAGFN